MNNQDSKAKNLIIGIFAILVIAFVYLIGKNSALTQQSVKETGFSQTTQTGISAQNNCLTAKESWNHIGETTCVEFNVGNPYRSSKGNVFLNEKKDYKTGFTVFIPANSVGNFKGDPTSLYGYKTIRVTGLLKTYQGHPEIIVNNPSQIEEVR